MPRKEEEEILNIQNNEASNYIYLYILSHMISMNEAAVVVPAI